VFNKYGATVKLEEPKPFMNVKSLTQPQLNALLANCAATAAFMSLVQGDGTELEAVKAMNELGKTLDACEETGVFGGASNAH